MLLSSITKQANDWGFPQDIPISKTFKNINLWKYMLLFSIFSTLFCIIWFMICPESLVMMKLSVTFCTWILHFLHFSLPGCHYLMLILFFDVAEFFYIKMFIWIPLTSQIPAASLNVMQIRVGTCFDMLNLWMCMQSYYGSAESTNAAGETGNQRLKYELRHKPVDMAFVLGY